jgi:hypothetical protein
MRYEELIENTEVSYHSFTGVIRFVSHSYVTLCVDPNRSVCLLIYPDQWKDLHLISK